MKEVNAEEIAICRMAVSLATSIKTSDVARKQGCIYATLCTLKEMMPNEFEEALVVFLKYGTGEDA